MPGRSSFLQAELLGVNMHYDQDADATPQMNIDGHATSLLGVTVDNTALANKVYLHFWDTGNPVMGTTPQHYQLPVAANAKQTLLFGREGVSFQSLSYAVTTDKGTSANTNPATPPVAYLNTVIGGD